ncbi:MAG: SCP2 sterol-binding domain-containing protein [Deltaproteobacteria bacterium]|nr:SCP2 sterol-binding domain-containing protein [Deltaproteobacteria bacterium]
MERLKVFSDEWCNAWADKIRESKDFAVFNKGWEGDIGCVISADPKASVPEPQYMYVNFYDGQVLDVRMADKETAENCKFVISGEYIRWKQVAKGELDAVKAMMQGKLKLKGNLPYVVKYVKGVQETIKCLIALDSQFPDD